MNNIKMFNISSNKGFIDWFKLMVKFLKLKNDRIRSFI